MKIKRKKQLLSELRQLKIRQRCLEKNTKTSFKLNELSEEEKEFIRDMDSLKITQEKNLQLYQEEAISIVRDCASKVKKFQANVVKFDLQQLEISSNISDLPRDCNDKSFRGVVLKMMAEINIMLSENLYVCTKELASLKKQ